jgi:hypothetical protein
MDPTLAKIYGTNQVEGEDLEKAAAAELASELAEDGQIDLDGLTEEDLEAAASEVLEQSDETEEEETEEAEETEKTAETEEEDEEATEVDQEKVAEADYLGRVMAHAFVQENRSIEKKAGLKDLGRAALKKGKSIGESAGRAFRRGKVAVKGYHSAAKTEAKEAWTGKRHVRSGADIGDAAKLTKKERLKKGGKAAARFLPHAGAAGAAGYGGKKALEKRAAAEKASALETLIQQRALEMLKESGIEVEDTTEKTAATKYDVLAEVVEKRARALLEANGYELVDAETEETEEQAQE